MLCEPCKGRQYIALTCPVANVNAVYVKWDKTVTAGGEHTGGIQISPGGAVTFHLPDDKAIIELGFYGIVAAGTEVVIVATAR